MIQFQYERASTAKAAVGVLANSSSAKIIAGGTNLVDLMKRNVMAPAKLVDINAVPLRDIRQQNGKISIGALALNSQVADDKLIIEKHPLLSQALNAGASAQIRNMATVGGNMMQRTRCPYFYDTALPCNKREPGSGCGALEGANRMHAIFGTSDSCIAVHPSDMCIALVALDATVLVAGPKGERRIPFEEFHRLPGNQPEKDNTLQNNEMIISVEIPDNAFSKNSHYMKIRDRASYAFALVSVAAALNMDGKVIRDARLAMGGVAHKPWRLKEAESGYARCQGF
jgi:xanthine dehydrogenase YagS FAD-binding subunit